MVMSQEAFTDFLRMPRVINLAHTHRWAVGCTSQREEYLSTCGPSLKPLQGGGKRACVTYLLSVSGVT